MNKKTVEAIKRQTREWLLNITLPTESDLGKGWNSPSPKLEAEILKSKSTWLTTRSVCVLVLEALEEVCPSYLDLKGGRLSDRIILDGAVDFILQRILQVPYRYRVYFQLDMMGSIQEFSFKLNGGVEFASHELIDVKGEASLGLRDYKGGRSYFYSVEVRGYISEKTDSRSGIVNTAAEQETGEKATVAIHKCRIYKHNTRLV